MTKSQKGTIWFAGTLLLTALGYKFAALTIITNAHIVVGLGVSAGYIASAYIAYQSLKLLWQFVSQKRKTTDRQIIAHPNLSPVPQDKNRARDVEDNKPLIPAPIPQDINRAQNIEDDRSLVPAPHVLDDRTLTPPIDDNLNELDRLLNELNRNSLTINGHIDSDPDEDEEDVPSNSLPGEDSDLGSTTASPIIPRHRHHRNVEDQVLQRLGTREIIPVERLNIASHKGKTYEGQVYVYPLKTNRH